MNIWFFVILLIACAMVIGPISMLRPSPAQKRKEQLRLHAGKSGLRFSMRQLPKLKTDIDRAPPMPVYFIAPKDKSRAIPEWILARTSYEHEGNFYREWHWQTDVRPEAEVCELLKYYLPQLPSSVAAITQSGLGTCVFWSEREGVETLDLLIKIVTEIDQASSYLD